MRSDRYREIFVQKIPIFYDTAISSIAVAHRKHCQEDPYYSVLSVNSWRTRDDIFKKAPIFSLYCHQLIAGARDVLTSNNNSQ